MAWDYERELLVVILRLALSGVEGMAPCITGRRMSMAWDYERELLVVILRLALSGAEGMAPCIIDRRMHPSFGQA